MRPLWSKAYPARLRLLGAAAVLWGFGGLALDTYSHIAGVWPWMQEVPVWGLGIAVEFALLLGAVLWAEEINKGLAR